MSSPALNQQTIPPQPKNGPAREALPSGSVVIDNVSKRFRKHTLQRKSYTTVKSSILEKIFKSRYPRNNYIAALNSISLNVAPGASVGLIGRNGSGKSTLLKLISGIYRPDSGSVKVQGRISALIELGAGFHPDFSGRENIYLGGVMYGLTRREIDQKFDTIVQYAELEDFIDDPVRTYSSGMYMRLGFSLAVHTEPDILLVDEVLAVGDAGFIHRCHETISEFRRRGKTMIFVTHDLDSVARWCDEAIWLDKGNVKDRGEPRRVIDNYLLGVEEKEELELEERNRLSAGIPSAVAEQLTEDLSSAARLGELIVAEDPTAPGKWGNGEVEIVSVKMLDGAGEAKWIFHAEEQTTVEVEFVVHEEVPELVFGIGILRADGICAHGTNTDIEGLEVPLPTATQPGAKPRGVFRFVIERLGLLDDAYFIDVALHRKDGTPYDYHHCKYKFFVRGARRYHGIYAPPHHWEFGELK